MKTTKVKYLHKIPFLILMTYEEKILKELTKIRSILEPEEEKTPPPKEKRKVVAFKDDFLEFLKKYRVMGLAVAFIMALYLGALVQALVNDLIMPVINFIPGVESWDTLTLGPFAIGHFLGALLTFVIISFVIFLLVKLTSKIGLE